jgi:hypothetical protein
MGAGKRLLKDRCLWVALSHIHLTFISSDSTIICETWRSLVEGRASLVGQARVVRFCSRGLSPAIFRRRLLHHTALLVITNYFERIHDDESTKSKKKEKRE